ncbi:hypothetical protein OG2516_05688 [Oceanicola granulosus HTCC2516]|uniref:Glycosyl transferase, WecB/TagA/CpsF family protein n=1 Tax=Oceanicola granulosus (strain ATCC BAA-861 / DSM 15982 / KCTC 12143 / HTCC2516) TaxID=314256 RepID=Q2CIL4_OCEGH|nr:WecB/TagA/CpsF family glycosyltransferase [Oceanicola granulosus]EAR52575.1 hypothetical protein OG2516_05688 [Oceanicola granulosus HTCC2516]
MVEPLDPLTRFENSPKRRVGDVDVDCVSRADLVAWCAADIAAARHPPRLVMDLNGHALSLARRDPAYRACLAAADIVHADGGFLVTLSRHRAGPAIPERSATTDMIHDFARAFSDGTGSFYLLGGPEEINAACARELRRRYPGLAIAGRRHGFFGHEDEHGIIDHINRSGADIVWIGLGKPREQAIARRWRDRLTARWVITCGGCFNYVTGHYRRAPGWMQRANLEWLHRLCTDPRRLARRYAVTSPHALWIALHG